MLRLSLIALLLFLVTYVCGETHSTHASDHLRPVVILRFEGVIAGGLDHFVKTKLAEIQKLRPAVVIFQIESPGGYLDVTYDIIARLSQLRDVKTVAYVPSEALSAAAIMSLACDEIVMHSDARFGDCGPIFLDESFMFRHAPEKVRSELAVRVRELAAKKSRPQALAEAMIDMDLEVFQVTHRESGVKTFMSETELAAHPEQDKWEKGPIVYESRRGNFLTVTGKRAIDLQLADVVVADRAELLQRYSGQAKLIEFQRTWVDTLVFVLNWPLVAALLIIVGLTALYIEFSSPGIGFGGTVAFACFALFFWSRFLGGTSTWLEVIGFACGVALVCMEVIVVPGLGIPGLMGAVLIIGSLIMAGQEFWIPESSSQWGQFADSLLAVVGALLGCLVTSAVLSRYWKSIAIWRGMAFSPSTDSLSTGENGKAEKTENASTLNKYAPSVSVGDWGIAVTQLGPGGKARFGHAVVDVIADGQFVEAGQHVRVVDLLGTRIAVEPASPSSDSAS